MDSKIQSNTANSVGGFIYYFYPNANLVNTIF